MANEGTWFNYARGGEGQILRSGRVRLLWNTCIRTGFFRTVQLNLLGWLAVLAPGAVIGGAVAAAAGWILWPLVCAGAVGSWLVALAADSIAWRNGHFSYAVGGFSAEAADAVASRLLALGVEVSVEEVLEPGEDEPEFWFQSKNRFRDIVIREIHSERELRGDS